MKQLLLKEIYRTIAKGYEWLYHQAIDKGHWRDIRSTALSSVTLDLREQINSRRLHVSKKWLLNTPGKLLKASFTIFTKLDGC